MSDRTIYLRPSTAHAWWKCAGFASLNAAMGALVLDERDNDVREDGTAAHWLAFESWHGRAVPVGTMSPNKRELTEELFAGVAEYHAWLRQLPVPPTLEQLLPVASVFRGCQDGTPDAWCVSGNTLYLPDLKMGFKPVEVWRNPQLVVYAWTIMCLFPHLQDAELTIIQPRAAHAHGTIRTWYVERAELQQLAESLQSALDLALAPDPVCTVNDACRNCAASGSCRTKQAAALGAAETSYDATPHVLTPVEIGYELTKLQQAAKHIEHRITGLTAQAESLVKRFHVPGFALKNADTRWRWKDDCVPQVKQLGALLGVDVHAPQKMKTVPQLRESFPGLDVEGMFAEKPLGERRLTATDPNEAIKAFTQRKRVTK